jgi:hypothetical protein
MEAVMRFIPIIFLAASFAASANPDILGYASNGEDEIRFYRNQAGCRNGAGLRAARYPATNPDDFVMGCWLPINDKTLILLFDDGRTFTIDRSQMRSKAPRIAM